MGYIVLAVVLVVVLVIFSPLALIWAVNTLFSMAIPFTFKTWLAALVLSAPFIATSRK